MRKPLVETIAADSHAAELLRRDRRIAELEGKLRDSHVHYQHTVAQLEAAEQRERFVTSFGAARDPERWDRDKKSSHAKYCAIVAASDWHLGEVIEGDKVGGLNEFNQAEAYRRVRKFFTKIPEYMERYAPQATTLYLWAGGDFISGYIHEELAESNSLSPSEECLWFRDLWTNGLTNLLREMPKCRIIIPTSVGNHGRTTQKSRVATAAENSFEQLTYWMVAKDWRKEPRVQWRIAEGYHNTQTILGRKVRFHHGDAINYWGGSGGITIPIRKAIGQWNKSARADLDVFGHFHEFCDGWHWVCNGSLVGYSPFSVKIKADYQPPVQAFLVFDGRHGLRQSTRIFVGDR